jgi:hypothetical protein
MKDLQNTLEMYGLGSQWRDGIDVTQISATEWYNKCHKLVCEAEVHSRLQDADKGVAKNNASPVT